MNINNKTYTEEYTDLLIEVNKNRSILPNDTYRRVNNSFNANYDNNDFVRSLNERYNIKNYTHKYSDVVMNTSQKYGLDHALVNNVIKAESRGNPNARSGANARGLMQITPIAEMEAKRLGLNIDDIYDPKQNIEAGTFLLSKFMGQFKNTELALAAYNAGPGNVRKWMKEYNTSDWNVISNKLKEKGVFKETRDYVPKVLKG